MRAPGRASLCPIRTRRSLRSFTTAGSAAAGSLFVAIHGEKTDGNRFVAAAIERGAAAIVSELPSPAVTAQALGAPDATPDATEAQAALIESEETLPASLPASVAWVQVPDARKALATIAANFYDRPADKLQLAGITGTNGKTTTSFLLDSIVHAAGLRSGLFGTIEYRTPLATYPAKTTTPESLDLQRFFAEIVREGGTHAVLEGSSHALALDRLWGCRFAVAVFTNLTRDHLDFHNTMENYFAAKRRLFEGTGAGRALAWHRQYRRSLRPAAPRCRASRPLPTASLPAPRSPRRNFR